MLSSYINCILAFLFHSMETDNTHNLNQCLFYTTLYTNLILKFGSAHIIKIIPKHATFLKIEYAKLGGDGTYT